MKIVYISSSIIPSRAANSIHVMKMCQALSNNNHEVVLLAPDRKDGMEFDVSDVYGFYGVKDNFRLQKINLLKIKGWNYLYGRKAASVSLSYKPDIVLCRNLAGCYYAAVAGQSVIFEAHSPIIGDGKIKEWIFRRLIKRKEFRRLVVITDALKRHYEEHFPGLKGKVLVAPDGADPMPEGVEPIALHNAGESLQVGYVGHLYSGRGIELMGEMARQCKWAEFHFVGGTKADVDKWRNDLKEVRNCHFHGFVPPVQADRYRKSFDVLLAPYQNKVSVYGGEGNTSKWMSPLKVFEYMSSNKPIIATDMPSIREVLECGRNSILCGAEDVSSWCQALEKLRSNSELSERLANEAHCEFLSRFTWKARAKNILDM